MEIDTIAVGDCLDVMAKMPDGCVDLVFADPWYYPKNQKTRNAFESDTFWDQVLRWMGELTRVVNKNRGHIFVCFSPQKMAKFEFLLSTLKVPLKSRIVWHYRNAGGRCASKDMFGKTYEMIYHIGYGDLNFPSKWDDRRFDVWTIATPQSNFKEGKCHEFQKPLGLLLRIIEFGSMNGALIFDPFMGSGTTAVAALKTGRHFYGCDINPDYIKLANERIEKTKLEMAQLSFSI